MALAVGMGTYFFSFPFNKRKKNPNSSDGDTLSLNSYSIAFPIKSSILLNILVKMSHREAWIALGSLTR